ncbi:hypothetical protein FGIG_08819 [Fasciola gigantica]|uniref:Uncharacterized protein n=1 Tax=Fasciola gigantica TaxID=46835 RepID=A0A504YPF3_FASGI|nr:hypothetical protein FGIG_08819 [Fasciola gigantica]
MSRRTKERENSFALLFVDALEVNFYERINPKRIKDHLISKARRQQINNEAGPVHLLVNEDRLELNKGLWWPETGGRFLSGSQLRDVFPLELDGKKFVIGVANTDTRQRRVLVFKAKSSKECEQIVDLLDSKREFQQTNETEATRSNIRLTDNSENAVSLHRSPSLVSFAPSPSVANFSEYNFPHEQRRNRLQSVEPSLSIYAAEKPGRQYGSSQRLFDYGEDTMAMENTVLRVPSRLCRTPIDRQINPDERSSSALPGDYTQSNNLVRRTSRLNRMDRGTPNAVGTIRRIPVLPNYVHPAGLYRSHSIQNFSEPTNDTMNYTHPECYCNSQENFTTNDEYGRSNKHKHHLNITINTNPKVNAEPVSYSPYHNSHMRPAPRMQSASPTPPPGFEGDKYKKEPIESNYCGGQNQGQATYQKERILPHLNALSQGSVCRTRNESQMVAMSPACYSPVVIVRETDNDVNNLAKSLRFQQIQNQVICFTNKSLPPKPVKPDTGTLKRIHTSFSQPKNDNPNSNGQANTNPEINQDRSYLQEVTIYPKQMPQTQGGKLITYTGDHYAADKGETYSDSEEPSYQASLNRIHIVKADNPQAQVNDSKFQREDSIIKPEINSRKLYYTGRRFP